jgi:hypothetical protein
MDLTVRFSSTGASPFITVKPLVFHDAFTTRHLNLATLALSKAEREEPGGAPIASSIVASSSFGGICKLG